MKRNEQKITAMIPKALLKQAMDASGDGLTQTIRKGLELVSLKANYDAVLSLKGKYADKPIDLDIKESRKERR